MLPGIVLAAGDSTRMGSPKALLPAPDGRPFVARIVRTLFEAGVEDLIVVTGRDHDAVRGALDGDPLPRPPRVVRNPDPTRGQLSSLWVGMDAAGSSSAPGMLVTLVDVPLVMVETVRAVLEAWRRSGAPIVRPAIGNRHGHPVIFDRAVLHDLRQAPVDAGAKAVVRAHERDVLNVAVADEGCLVDVDTREDYERLAASPRARA